MDGVFKIQYINWKKNPKTTIPEEYGTLDYGDTESNANLECKFTLTIRHANPIINTLEAYLNDQKKKS